MSRIVQFYAARVLRSSVIEDLGCHWYKRTIPFLPIPAVRSPDERAALEIAGQAVLAADDQLADRYRAINAAMKDGLSRTLNDLFVDGDPLIDGLDLNGVGEDPVPLLDLTETDDGLITADATFVLLIPNADLRTFVGFTIQRRVDADAETPFAREQILGIAIPAQLSLIATLIRSLTSEDLTVAFADAQTELDRVVALMLGLSSVDRDYAINQMSTDPILKQMRPMYAHRGLRVQPYVDHSEADRYA